VMLRHNIIEELSQDLKKKDDEIYSPNKSLPDSHGSDTRNEMKQII